MRLYHDRRHFIKGVMMKRALKWTGFAALFLAAALGMLAIYVTHALPHVAPADQSLSIAITPARVQRGDYLAHHVNDCFSCHSVRDWSIYGAPVKPGSEFAGGEQVFDRRIGLPGTIYPKNITPYHLKNYSDGELVRVLRTGVRRDGQPLFPMMPYLHIAQMTQEDLYSLIAYLRTLKEVKNDVADHELDFPLNILVHTMPQEAPAYPAPVDPKDSVAQGRYLVNVIGCMECHTPVDAHHQPLPGMDMAGGMEFPLLNVEGDLSALPGGFVRTANLTPDPQTGIGAWSREAFLGAFRDWRGKSGQAKMVKVKNGEFQTVMPWPYFAGMTDADLGSIYDYLRTLKPVKHAVVKYSPPKG
jgi:mono/diheme cytochrome c family protein